MKITTTKLISFFLAVSIVTVSCNENNSSEPPELPSESTMQADFSEMENAQKAKASVAAESNFTTALTATAVTRLILNANLAIPRALVRAAQQHDPEEIAEGEWEWSFSTQANQNQFAVRLIAVTNSQSDVEWRFFVSNSATTPVLDNALLFHGNTNFDATNGTWIYYDPASGDQVSTLEWDINDDQRALTLEVTSDRNDKHGDTIEYSFDGTVKTMVYTDVSANETTTIEFNTETKAGFMISPDYNNGVKACWDEDLNNTSCSS